MKPTIIIIIIFKHVRLYICIILIHILTNQEGPNFERSKSDQKRYKKGGGDHKPDCEESKLRNFPGKSFCNFFSPRPISEILIQK